MKRTIDGQSTPNIWQLTDQNPVLEIYANEMFDTSSGETVLAGNVDQQDFYRKVVLSVAGNVLTIPAVTNIDTTEDSADNQRATYSAYIRAAGREPLVWVEKFSIPPAKQSQTSINWTDLKIHKRGTIFRDPSSTYTKQEVRELIEQRLLTVGVPGTATLLGGDPNTVTVTRASMTEDGAVSAYSLVPMSGTLSTEVENGLFRIISSDGGDEGLVLWTAYDDLS